MKCKVISRNSLAMVVDYDGTAVQLPNDNTDNEYAYVTKMKNGGYKISEKCTLDHIDDVANGKKPEKADKETIAELYEV